MSNYDEQLETSTKEIEDKKKLKNNHRMRDLISLFLIVAGIVVISIPLIGKAIANSRQDNMMEQFYASLEAEDAGIINTDFEELNDALLWGSNDSNQDESSENYQEIYQATESATELAEMGALNSNLDTLGVIEISKIDVKYPIGEGADLDTLRYVVGHVPESAALNTIGNSVLAGHRSHSYGAFFNRLDELVVGDQIKITGNDGTMVTYQIYDKLIVDPTDLSVMKGSSQYRVITLITCHPIFNPDSRLIVHAIDVEQLESIN